MKRRAPLPPTQQKQQQQLQELQQLQMQHDFNRNEKEITKNILNEKTTESDPNKRAALIDFESVLTQSSEQHHHYPQLFSTYPVTFSQNQQSMASPPSYQECDFPFASAPPPSFEDQPFKPPPTYFNNSSGIPVSVDQTLLRTNITVPPLTTTLVVKQEPNLLLLGTMIIVFIVVILVLIMLLK